MDSPVISFSFESNQKISEQVYKKPKTKESFDREYEKARWMFQKQYSDFPYRGIVPENGENSIEITSIYKYNKLYLLFKKNY